MRIRSPAHATYAATMVGLGLLGLAQGHFGALWQPVSASLPARQALAYLCNTVTLLTGLGLLWRLASAARVLWLFLLLWFGCFKLPVLLRAPLVEVSWESAGETAVLTAGAWVLYAWFAAAWDRRRLAACSGEHGVRIARAVFGLALLPLGLAHLVYVRETAALVPSWMPVPLAWAYLTGGAYLAAGVAVLTGRFAALAAGLATAQMALFTLLVWVPRVAFGKPEAAVASECVLSWALTVAAWVVADSYRVGPASPVPERTAAAYGSP